MTSNARAHLPDAAARRAIFGESRSQVVRTRLYAPYPDSFAYRVLRYFADAQPGEWAYAEDLARWFPGQTRSIRACEVRYHLKAAIKAGWIATRTVAGDRKERFSAGLKLGEFRP